MAPGKLVVIDTGIVILSLRWSAGVPDRARMGGARYAATTSFSNCGPRQTDRLLRSVHQAASYFNAVHCDTMSGAFIFLKGLFLGLIMCAPVGPVGLFCVRRTLTYGPAAGMASVLGAATVDGIYCAVAGMGVTFVFDFVMHEQSWLGHVGALVLVLLGLKISLAEPKRTEANNNRKGLLGAYASTFLFMLANPLPILVFAAVFAALGVGGPRADYVRTAILVVGVFLGSALWAPILIAVLRFFQPQFDFTQRLWVNRISGAIIAAFGVVLEVLNLTM